MNTITIDTTVGAIVRYDGLAQLEKHTHQHVHMENNVLFPKAQAVR
jgi:iron-sulfur cluster repair protein YtfE (RIC family)